MPGPASHRVLGGCGILEARYEARRASSVLLPGRRNKIGLDVALEALRDHRRRRRIAYWPPGPDVAVFYRHDGQSIPEPGIVVLGRVESAEPLAFRS